MVEQKIRMNLGLAVLAGLISFPIISLASESNKDSILFANYDSVNVHSLKVNTPKSVLFSSYPDSTYPTLVNKHSCNDCSREDTLELAPISAKLTRQDSISKEFKRYWARLEKEEGFDKFKDQIRSRDIDNSWLPRWYFFDSTLVITPLWFRIRLKD